MDNKYCKPYCVAPWVSLQYGALVKSGGATPCCEWQGDSYKKPLENYSTSDFLSNIKKAMIDHNYELINHTCKTCIELEKLNIESTRQQLHNAMYDLSEGFVIIDYRPSNLCNLKCRMCFATSSSLIAEEENKIITQYNTDDILSLNMSSIKKINIAGGEPSISADVHNFLNFLITNDYAKNIELTFATNATNANKKWMNLINKFKKCFVIISLDGTNKIYEYIRTNANWISILKNINTYEESDLEVSFQITASMYNIPVVEEWIEWFFNKTTRIYPVEGHSQLSLNALKTDIRFEKIDYLNQFNHNITNDIISILKQTSFNKKTFDYFKRYTSSLDKKRNTNILNVSKTFIRVLE